MMKFLVDPKIFNYLIMVLYLLNSLRWLVEYATRDTPNAYGQMCYWLAALAITATVTFQMGGGK